MLSTTSRKYAKGLLLLVEDLMLLVVAAAKLPILDLFEFDLWKMKIEQYFLMTDYSLWEVILNGDSPMPTRVVVETKKVQKTLLKQQYENFTGSSSESLDQIHDRLQKLISQLEILDLEVQSLDDLFNNLKIYEAKVSSSSSTSHTTQNIAFVSSQNTDNTNEPVSVVTSVSAASTKPPASILSNVDNLNADDLEEMNLKWQMSMLTMRARWFLQRTGRNLGANGTTSIGFDMSKVECYKCHKREDIKLLKLDVMLRDNALVELRKKFEAAKKERDKLKYTLEKFQTSSKNLSKLLEIQITNKTGLGYDNQVFHSQVFACDKLTSSESDVSMPTSPVHDRETVPNVFNIEPSITKPNKEMSQSNRPSAPLIEDWVSNLEDESEGEPMPTQKAPSFVQNSEHVKSPRTFVKPIEHPPQDENLRKDNHRMTHLHSKRHVVPTSVLTRSRLVPLNTARPVTTTVPQTHVKHQRPAKHIVNKPHSPIRRPINHKPAPKNSNFHQKVTTVKVKQVNVVQGTKGNWGNPQQALKDKGVIDSGCSRHMIGNISYLSDFEEINRGYVIFGGNLKGGKITGKDTECVVLSFDFKLPDKNHVLLRVPKENNMYNVDLKNIVSSGDLTCLFAKATLDESNLWHRRLGRINFKTMNKLFFGGNLVRGLPSKVFENYHTCVACKKSKQHRAFCKSKPVSSVRNPYKGNQPTSSTGIQENLDVDPQNTYADAAFDDKQNESEIYVSPSSSNKLKKHDEKAKREAKGKCHTNNFNIAGPSDTVVSPNFEIGGKSSFVDPSQYPDDRNMPALEDIIYSDDEEDVGAEADFSNLETSITVSHILTTRVHKDHHVTQIIGDLSSALQTRSMTRMVKEQGGLTQINDEDFHTWFEDLDYPDKVYKVVKAIYGLHQAPRAWYENGFQKGKIDQNLFIKNQKSNEALAFPGQMATGKENSNPFMADSLPKTILLTIRRICINMSPFEFSLVYLVITSMHFLNAVSSKLMLFGLTINAVHLMLLGHKCMSENRTAWNEFSSSMASAVSCLTTSRKFIFSKYIFDSMVRNVDSPLKFLMYPQFLQLMINAQVADLLSHNTKYTSPALTQKVFANMRRIGKGFSGVDTPLFDGMLVQQQVQAVKDGAEDEDDDNEVSAKPTLPSPTPDTPPPPP
nr:hypothetical protein [Tanacetum cinerariifolium]